MVRLPDLREEDGFTLIELMVVVVILAVLLLMATSTFAGVKARAQDSAAKQTAAKTLETGRIIFTDRATYATATPVELMAAEPSLDAVDETTNSDGPDRASTWVPDAATTGYQFVAAVYSDAGNCFYIRDWVTLGIGFAVERGVAPAQCTADQATTVTFGTRWPSS
ncbi:MAG TPA: prepilin-type N-terminal cleavage/methylation domain-containing protein [Actinomycetota bacterium]|jgi:type IV pilus assembly protein PilA|nr:prepilin-type N-terminal cleavage/methylation domain-containing protein [Actinomycetota bacterium]